MADEGVSTHQIQPGGGCLGTGAKISASVNDGPLESERIALMKRIQAAQNRGVGIQNYLSAFQELEKQIQQKNASAESIRTQLNSIDYALNNQLLHQKQMSDVPTPASITTGSVKGKSLVDTVRSDRAPSLEPEEDGLPLEKARLYMLSLVNTDRAKYHCSPLGLDSVASTAAQMQADEMASLGCCKHWDSYGRKPWQRYTDVGGIHSVGENLVSAHSSKWNPEDSREFRILKNPQFSKQKLIAMESCFMHEQPPNDGHRREILRPEHNKLGVGLSCSVNSAGDSFVCLAQEFINEYGEYSKFPQKIVRGAEFQMSGVLSNGLSLRSVEVRREAAPILLTKSKLEKMPDHCSLSGDSIASCSPEDKPTTIKVWKEAEQQHFSVWIVPEKDWKSGLYYVLIWAVPPEGKEAIVISTRTFCLD